MMVCGDRGRGGASGPLIPIPYFCRARPLFSSEAEAFAYSKARVDAED